MYLLLLQNDTDGAYLKLYSLLAKQFLRPTHFDYQLLTRERE